MAPDRQAESHGPTATLSVSTDGVEDLSALDALRTGIGWRPLHYLDFA